MVMLKNERQDKEMWDGGYDAPARRPAPPPAPAKAAPEEMVDDALLRNASDPQRWQDAAEAINALAAKIDMAAACAVSPAPDQDKATQEKQAAALAPLQNVFRVVGNMQWPGNRFVYTYGRMDVDVLALCCARRLIDWQQAFNGKAACGTPEELEKFAEKARLAGAALNLNTALACAAKPQLMVAGLWYDGNIDTTEKLFKMGADPGGKDGNGSLFVAVVEQGRKDIGKIFARYGQHGLLDVGSWAHWAQRNRKPRLYADLREINCEYGNFHMVDNATLQETKTLADGASQLKTVFNFSAARVHEILDTPNPRQTVVKDFSFDDYAERALEDARAKLIELGGNPPPLEGRVSGKSPLPKPAGLTRKS
jgi:hypothetical protein